MSEVIVVGSANRDYSITVPRIPLVGETLLASSMVEHTGGKGANQAIAAARAGASVEFIGCVGDDQDGQALIRALHVEGIVTSRVEIASTARTGLAMVLVGPTGDNSIVVVPGANNLVSASRVSAALQRMTMPRVLVLQCELKPEVVEHVVRAAPPHARVILNLAPFAEIAADVLAVCDPLVMNQLEAAALVRTPLDSVDSALAACTSLLHYARSVVVTLGALGAVWASDDGRGHVAAPSNISVVDTTGAGDAFVGALAASLARGNGLPEATEWGVRAGTIAVTKLGAQSSYPTHSDLLALVQ